LPEWAAVGGHLIRIHPSYDLRHHEAFQHDREDATCASLRDTPAILCVEADLVTVSELAERILAAFRNSADSKGVGEITATSLYKSFSAEGSHDMIQQAIRYLLDRDFIAAHSYSLTAKGRMKSIQSAADES
jgi:hypothetical protein